MASKSRFLGVPRLRRKLRRIDPELRTGIAVVVDDTAQKMLADMKANVPVSRLPSRHSGHLRDLLAAQTARNGLSARVGLITPQARREGFYWRYLEHGTVKMPARPFVLPALLRAEASYEPRIRKAVDTALDRASRSEPIQAGSE